MNWVGGIRRRVLQKEEEKRRQEQFFAKHTSDARSRNPATKDRQDLTEKHPPVRGRSQAPHITSIKGIQNQRKEDIVCKRIQYRTPQQIVSKKSIKSHGRHLGYGSKRRSSLESSVTIPEQCYKDLNSTTVSKSTKKIQVIPSSLHGPFSRFLLKLEVKGIQRRLEEDEMQKQSYLRHQKKIDKKLKVIRESKIEKDGIRKDTKCHKGKSKGEKDNNKGFLGEMDGKKGPVREMDGKQVPVREMDGKKFPVREMDGKKGSERDEDSKRSPEREKDGKKCWEREKNNKKFCKKDKARKEMECGYEKNSLQYISVDDESKQDPCAANEKHKKVLHEKDIHGKIVKHEKQKIPSRSSNRTVKPIGKEFGLNKKTSKHQNGNDKEVLKKEFMLVKTLKDFDNNEGVPRNRLDLPIENSLWETKKRNKPVSKVEQEQNIIKLSANSKEKNLSHLENKLKDTISSDVREQSKLNSKITRYRSPTKQMNVKYLQSSLLAGAPKFRRILSLTPGRHRGRIWAPLNLSDTNTFTNDQSNIIKNDAFKALSNVKKDTKCKDASDLRRSCQSSHGNTVEPANTERKILEANRLALLLGPAMKASSGNPYQVKCSDLGLNLPSSDDNSLGQSIKSSNQGSLLHLDTSFIKHSEQVIGTRCQAKYGRYDTKDVVYTSSKTKHNKSSDNSLSDLVFKNVEGTNTVIDDTPPLSAMSTPYNGLSKPKLCNLTRGVMEVSNPFSFPWKGKDKTPYMERDSVAGCWKNDSTSGDSSMSSKTPVDSYFDRSCKDSHDSISKSDVLFVSGDSDRTLHTNSQLNLPDTLYEEHVYVDNIHDVYIRNFTVNTELTLVKSDLSALASSYMEFQNQENLRMYSI